MTQGQWAVKQILRNQYDLVPAATEATGPSTLVDRGHIAFGPLIDQECQRVETDLWRYRVPAIPKPRIFV